MGMLAFISSKTGVIFAELSTSVSESRGRLRSSRVHLWQLLHFLPKVGIVVPLSPTSPTAGCDEDSLQELYLLVYPPHFRLRDPVGMSNRY